ncbi:MAG: hypothetical protein ACO23H_13235 [Alphaproteobacteria bacterium]
MEATTLDQAVDSLLAPQDNSEETVEATEEPTQDAESEFVEDIEDEEVIEASDDDGEAEYEDDATEYTDEVEAVEDDSETLYDITIDGKPERWTLSQLKQSAAGQGYIQQKMRENAEQAKQLEQMKAQLAQQQQQVLQVAQQVQQGGLQAPTPPSKDLFENDPIGYMEEKMKYDEAVQEYNAKVGQIRQLQQQQQQQTQAQRQSYLQEQARLLAEAIPDIVHPEKGDTIKKGLIDTGVAYGFSEEEMANVADHRYVRALNDARKWRELQANKVKAKEKGSNVRPVVKAGAKRRADGAATRRKQEAKAMKSGNIAEMADLLINPKL